MQQWQPIEDDLGRWIEKPARTIGGRVYRRWMVRTHLIRSGERLEKSLAPYLDGQLTRDDILVLSEKIVAISEGRSVLLNMVKPSRLAQFLSRHVRPLGYGLGLRRAETMEMAIREAGLVRIVMASVVGALDRVTGGSGGFYRVAGRRVASIDGPGPTTIPPYNQYIVLAPLHPEQVIRALGRRFGCQVVVVDVNDVGSEVLATTVDTNPLLVQQLMRDNPMGQGAQGTPVGVLRAWRKEPATNKWPTRPAPSGAGWVMPLGGSADVALKVGRESFDTDRATVDL